MCKAFSGVVTRSGEVLWEAGVDSHDELIENANLPPETEEHPAKLMYARVEITPPDDAKDGYLHPELTWVLHVDQAVRPTWFKARHEEAALKACEEWKRKVYSLINLAEALNPVDPFKVEPPTEITSEHISLLRTWATVGATVRDTVWAYIGSLFLGITEWKGWVSEGYPFQCAVDLWRLGLVPSFDGKTWRLHSRNGVAYEISKEELMRVG